MPKWNVVDSFRDTLLVPHLAHEPSLRLRVVEARSSSGGGGIGGIAFLVDEAGEGYALGGLFR